MMQNANDRHVPSKCLYVCVITLTASTLYRMMTVQRVKGLTYQSNCETMF